jgi:hypothetical protein
MYYTQAQFHRFLFGVDKEVRFLSHCLVEEYPTDWHKDLGILYVTFEGQALKGSFRPPGLIEV